MDKIYEVMRKHGCTLTPCGTYFYNYEFPKGIDKNITIVKILEDLKNQGIIKWYNGCDD
jgi:hypothetical protein